MPLGDLPFTTKDFAPEGGGIDFLGVRAVNLRILAVDLLPGINNATRDLGFFCIGAWIPWKFSELCSGRASGSFTEENYARFQEAIEVVVSYGQRDGAAAQQMFEPPHRKIGVEQDLPLPSPLTFLAAHRTSATSVFAAPLYGPALRALGLHEGFASGVDGVDTSIHATMRDGDTLEIVRFAETLFTRSSYYQSLLTLTPGVGTSAMLDDLGRNGMHPSVFRAAPAKVKQAFIRKLLPPSVDGELSPRTLTANLLLQTLKQAPDLTTNEIRNAWYTGLGRNGRSLQISLLPIVHQLERWSIFMCRQYQRYCLEQFFHCFELGLKSGCRSIRELVEEGIRLLATTAEGAPNTLDAEIRREASAARLSGTMEEMSKGWRSTVGWDSAQFDWVSAESVDLPIRRALTLLARWHLRAFSTLKEYARHPQIQWDGADRISLAWFSAWLEERRNLPLATLLTDFYSQLIFGQHLRIALARFDGAPVQRLRCTLDDHGIVQTLGVMNGKALTPAFMEDRLEAFILLLQDLDIFRASEGKMLDGANAIFVPPT
jgi:hypothetical protein